MAGFGQNAGFIVRVRAPIAVALALAALAAAVPARAARAEVAPAPEVWLPPASVLHPLTTNPGQVLRAVEAADFVLSLQRPEGAILDSPNAGIANTDSHMQYALIGLAAAYRATGKPRFLEGLRAGVDWLGKRQRSDGSWWIAYRSRPPFEPVRSARGVSATAGLYLYDLWLYRELGGAGAREWVERRLWRARRALRFLDTMRAPDGTYLSAHVRRGSGFQRSTYRFTSDQADVYLGLRAAADLLGEPGLRNRADRLRARLFGPAFFLGSQRRYAQGVHGDGRRDPSMNVLAIWPQGWVPWVLGPSPRTRKAVGWLRSKTRSDGSVKAWPGDPVYTLSAEDVLLGSVGVDGPASDHPATAAAASWMVRVPRDPDGGLRDSLRRDIRFCNVAGFAVIAWLRLPALVP